MTSLKPYLLRSVYEWITDNHLTPHLLADASHPSVIVPEQYVNDGKIVLNIRPQAVEALSLGNHEVIFNTRFNGKPTQVVIPIFAVLSLYAKENGRGMVFEPEEHEDFPPQEPAPPSKPQLRIVK